MFKNPVEDTLKRSELCIQEIKRLEKERQEILNNLLERTGMTSEEITQFCKDPNNFPPEELEYAKRLSDELNEKLKQELANIQNPIKSKKNLSSLNIPSYAIFVR
jgi:DNA-binding transcriptional MerR regulator